MRLRPERLTVEYLPPDRDSSWAYIGAVFVWAFAIVAAVGIVAMIGHWLVGR